MNEHDELDKIEQEVEAEKLPTFKNKVKSSLAFWKRIKSDYYFRMDVIRKQNKDCNADFLDHLNAESQKQADINIKFLEENLK